MGQDRVANSLSLRRQITYLKSLPPPLLAVMDLRARGKLVQAEQLCKRFMQKNPTHAEGMRLLADIAIELGALDEATLLLDTGQTIDPDNERIRFSWREKNMIIKQHCNAQRHSSTNTPRTFSTNRWLPLRHCNSAILSAQSRALIGYSTYYPTTRPR